MAMCTSCSIRHVIKLPAKENTNLLQVTAHHVIIVAQQISNCCPRASLKNPEVNLCFVHFILCSLINIDLYSVEHSTYF